MTKFRNLLLAAFGIGATCAGLFLGALGLARLTLTHALYGIAVIGALIIAAGIGMFVAAVILGRRDGRGELP